MAILYRIVSAVFFLAWLSSAASAQFVCGASSLISVDVLIGSPESTAGLGGLACGSTSTAAGNATAVGVGASGTGVDATGIGANVNASGLGSVAIGSGSNATAANSIAIGASVSARVANQVAIGNETNTYSLAGITSSASVAAQVGTLRLVTTDSTGNIASIDPSVLIDAFSFDPTAINTQLADHDFRIQNVERKVKQANRGVAAAMALAGGATIPAGKTYGVSASWGTFGGENAFGTSAVAAVYDGVYLSGGVAVSGTDVGGRAGVSMAW